MDSKETEQSLKLAEHYFRSNNYSFAKQILDKVVKEDSNNSKANELLAYIYGNLGQVDISFDLLTVACNQNDCSPEALYYLGSIQLKRSLFPEAIKTFKNSILKGGEFFEALHDLATAQAGAGDLVAALNNYQKCLKFGDVSFELFFNIARTFDELKRYEEAIAHYDRALDLKPDYAEAWSNKGNVLNELKRYEEAIAHYDRALDLKPDYAEAWSNKGNTFGELKRYEEAIAHYDRALDLKPDYAEAWSNKGVTLHELKRYEEAIAHYDRALDLKPDYAEGWSIKGVILHELKRYEEAIAHYDRALDLKPDYAEAWSNKGNVLNELKRYEEAIAHYDRALDLKPDYAEAWSNKGVTLHELKRYEEAIAHYDRALDLKPDYAEAWSNKGNVLNELKRYEEAIAHYDRALDLKPDYAEAWSNKGNVLNELKRYEEAIAHYDRALDLKPDYAEAWSNKGNVLNELKRYEEAIAHYDRALDLKPDYAEAWSNKGNVLNELKRYEEAIAHYDRALDLKPDYAEAWSNKGNVLNELKRYEEAIAHYDRALDLKPDYAEAWSNKGVTLHELKRYEEAIAHYDRALDLKPDYAEAWSNKGNVLNELKRYEEAIAHYDRALDLKPDYAEAWSNKGNTFGELKRYEEAIAHYDRALDLKPDIDWRYGDLIHAKMSICNWLNFPDSLEIISKKVMANQRVTSPFTLLALNDDAALHKKSSEIFIQAKFPLNPFSAAFPKFSRGQKIKIGYFSADFHNHATGYLMAELFELHDKNKFELVGFSFGPMANDEIRQRLKKSFDQFIEVANKSDMEIAQISRDLNIDIAIDLKGFTQNSRPGVFANRAAPIQVNYLGYPGTMGANYMDYIIADKIIIPIESQSCYSERVVFLPNSYQVNDRKRLISEFQFTRKELGLPETGFVFCCFNNNYKILPSTFYGWMRILKSVDGSVLWLLKDNPWVEENLKKEAEKQCVDSQRLVFAERMPLPEHLARHRQADLFLDTSPCNAHTTTSDALWTGLPVLTLIGKSFASRVAASLLSAIDLPELIANTQEEYEALAIEMALNPDKLVNIKLKLASNRLITPLFDTPLFAKNIEAAYIKMMERYRADLQPDHISII